MELLRPCRKFPETHGDRNQFQAFVTTLEKNQVEYDLGSENIIKDLGKVENGRFIVGNASYSTVVLPPMMETLNKPTFNLLQQFVEQGGQIITFSAPHPDRRGCQ